MLVTQPAADAGEHFSGEGASVGVSARSQDGSSILTIAFGREDVEPQGELHSSLGYMEGDRSAGWSSRPPLLGSPEATCTAPALRYTDTMYLQGCRAAPVLQSLTLVYNCMGYQVLVVGQNQRKKARRRARSSLRRVFVLTEPSDE